MKAYSIKCPDCGAPLNVETDKEFIFCTHCGNKIILDDESKRVKIDITNTQRSIDETEIRKAEIDLEKTKHNDTVVLKLLGAMAIIGICAGIFGAIIGAISSIGTISRPASASSYRGENYQAVEQEFEAMGFKDIDLISTNSGGFFTSDGDVTRISIGGNSEFSKGDTVKKKDPVIITYYSKNSAETDAASEAESDTGKK